MDDVEGEKSVSTGIRINVSRSFNLVASRYTDYAIPSGNGYAIAQDVKRNTFGKNKTVDACKY
jgi:hypothetical protein